MKLMVTRSAEKLADHLFPDADRTVLLGNQARPPRKYGGKFDAFLSFHDLAKVSHHHTIETLKNWRHVLKRGGEMHLFVPSLEWAAEQILSERPSPLTLWRIYGPQTEEDQFFVNGFVLRKLRADLQKAGLLAERAQTGHESIEVNGDVLDVENHYVMARKPEE